MSLNGILSNVFGPTAFKAKRPTYRVYHCECVCVCEMRWAVLSFHVAASSVSAPSWSLLCFMSCWPNMCLDGLYRPSIPEDLCKKIKNSSEGLCCRSVSRPLSVVSMMWRDSSAAVYLRCWTLTLEIFSGFTMALETNSNRLRCT